MPTPDPKALETFSGLVKAAPGVTVKPMFGNFGAFTRGKMFMGVFGDAVFVKLSPDDHAAAMALPGAGPFEPMKGRAMKEYVVLPPSVLADKKKAKAWVEKSLAYVRTGPVKKAAKT